MSDKVTSNARARKQKVTYSDLLLAEILDRVAAGESLNAICSTEDMPTRKTFFEWVANDRTIKDQYEMAILMRADLYAEQILEIADDGKNDTYETDSGTAINHDVIARSRLRVDARKWLASKMAPKKYGDKVAIGGAEDLPPIPVASEITFRIVRPDGNKPD